MTSNEKTHAVVMSALGGIAVSLIIFCIFVAHVASLKPVRASAPVGETYTKAQFVASLDVARVFGRSQGCAEADPKLIREIADAALKVSLDPRIFAATIAVESGCNQYATSAKGAIGLCQITARTWKNTYDFEHQYNLLNPEDNLRVGAAILSGLVKQYGTAEGLHRYNGLGADGDPSYAGKIESMEARR